MIDAILNQYEIDLDKIVIFQMLMLMLKWHQMHNQQNNSMFEVRINQI